MPTVWYIAHPLLNLRGSTALEVNMIAVLRATLASLDESLTLLHENSAKLRAAKSVDIKQLIELLNNAAESARVVRELVLSELPDASWQSREELEGSVE